MLIPKSLLSEVMMLGLQKAITAGGSTVRRVTINAATKKAQVRDALLDTEVVEDITRVLATRSKRNINTEQTINWIKENPGESLFVAYSLADMGNTIYDTVAQLFNEVKELLYDNTSTDVTGNFADIDKEEGFELISDLTRDFGVQPQVIREEPDQNQVNDLSGLPCKCADIYFRLADTKIVVDAVIEIDKEVLTCDLTDCQIFTNLVDNHIQNMDFCDAGAVMTKYFGSTTKAAEIISAIMVITTVKRKV